MRQATVRELTVYFSESRSKLVVRWRKDVSYERYEVFRQVNQYEVVEQSLEVLSDENDNFIERLADFDKEYYENEPRRKNRYVSEDKKSLPTGQKVQKETHWVYLPPNIGFKKRLIKQMCKVAEVSFQHKRVPDKLI